MCMCNIGISLTCKGTTVFASAMHLILYMSFIMPLCLHDIVILPLQAFRLQLALGDGHAMPAVPTIQDQRLHDKPHHQPILFINDSLAPDLQPVLLHATLPPGTQDGVSTNPHKQTPKPSALRSALNAVSKSFSAYHKGSKQSALQHEGASDMISSQPAMHHSYSMGQPDWLVQSRHASLDFTASGAYSGGEGVQLLGGAEGNLAVKVPLRPTSSCPAMSPVGHTRSSLMHSLSRSGMNYSPKQLATSRRRYVLGNHSLFETVLLFMHMRSQQALMPHILRDIWSILLCLVCHCLHQRPSSEQQNCMQV